MTLACEDANSKLVDLVTIADFDDEMRTCWQQFGRDFYAEDCSRY